MRSPRVAIIGAGISGLCTAIKLREAGIESFTVFEKSDRVGGTWQFNTYPGLFVDVPSRYFQFSFAPNADWSHVFPPGEEVRAYLERVADQFAIREKIRFGVELIRAEWVDDEWCLHSAAGEEARADFVVAGCGFLHRPVVPAIPGLETFGGAAFHSARWDHEVDLADKRVAVIGTGSTGVQIVTALAGRTARLLQFVRTPQWIFPAPNPRYRGFANRLLRRSATLNRWVYRGYQRTFEAVFCRALVSPGWQRRTIAWLCRANLRSVRDDRLRESLTPAYEPACKRLALSGGYYRALQRHRVSIVRDPIARVERDAIVTADGTRHPVDVLVLATGFDTHAYVRPMEFVGPGGRTLSDAWGGGPRAYATVAVPGLPNLFLLLGPKSPVNVSSNFNIVETQVGYVLDLVERWRRGVVDAVAPTDEATERFEHDLAGGFDGTVWVTGCDSWYIGADGTPQIWPWMPERHRELLAEPDLADFEPVAPAGARADDGAVAGTAT